MKSLVFDSSAIISLSTNNLIWVLKKLKKKFNGEFFISDNVKKEVVDVPLKTKKYKLEALMIADHIAEGDLKFFKNINLNELTNRLLNIVNSIYKAKGEYIKVVDRAEIEGLALAVSLKSNAYVVDERTLRMLVEAPENLMMLLRSKLHTDVIIDKRSLTEFQRIIGNINIMRTAELMVMAYELGLLDEYKEGGEFLKDNFQKEILDGVLWGLKLNGCAISGEEINDILELEKFK